MPEFIIAYHGQPKKPATPEEGMKHMGEWKEWLSGLGEAVINPGSPIGKSQLVTPDGIVEDTLADAMFGFTTVRAENLDAALEMASSCPVVSAGGTLRVAELMAMPGG